MYVCVFVCMSYVMNMSETATWRSIVDLSFDGWWWGCRYLNPFISIFGYLMTLYRWLRSYYRRLASLEDYTPVCYVIRDESFGPRYCLWRVQHNMSLVLQSAVCFVVTVVTLIMEMVRKVENILDSYISWSKKMYGIIDLGFLNRYYLSMYNL